MNILDTVKLLFRKDKELYSSLHSILGFYPRNIELYRCALAHRSSGFKGKDGHLKNNERLEFLGDAIIEAAVSDIVYRHFANKDEGFLTNTRSKLVQRDTLGRISSELGLDHLLRTNGHMGGHNNYTGGNAFEALVGAIYLDRGYHCAFRFIQKRILTKYMNLEKVAKREVNFKSKVLEWSQRNHLEIEFRVSDTLKPGTDAPVFTSQVFLEGVATGQGTGYTKKESQQNAARDTLRLLQKPNFVDKILEAKQKRTAMEADLVSAPPKPDALEGEAAATAGRRTQTADKAAKPRRSRSKKASETTPQTGKAKQTQKAAADDAQAAPADAPKKRRRRSGSSRAKQVPAAANAAGEKSEAAEPQKAAEPVAAASAPQAPAPKTLPAEGPAAP